MASFNLKIFIFIVAALFLFSLISYHYYESLVSLTLEDYLPSSVAGPRTVQLVNGFGKDVAVYFQDEQDFGSFLGFLQPGDSLEVTAVDGQEFFATEFIHDATSSAEKNSWEKLTSVVVREGKSSFNLHARRTPSLRNKAARAGSLESTGTTSNSTETTSTWRGNLISKNSSETAAKKKEKAGPVPVVITRLNSSSKNLKLIETSQQHLELKSSSVTSLSYEFNVSTKSEKHYSVKDHGNRGGGYAMSAKFRSLSSKNIDLWYDDGGSGILQAHLKPGQETTTTTYEGHRFYAKYASQKNSPQKICSFTIHPEKVFYTIDDPTSPADSKILTQTQKELSFSEDYFKRTGIHWRHYFGPDGPRPPPKLFMWPAEQVGQVHRARSDQSKWTCDGERSACMSSDGVLMDLEVLSLTPRAYVIEDFLGEFECDHIIKMSKDVLKESSVGDAGAGIFHSNTRTSLNTWLSKDLNPIVSTIFNRAADLLHIDRKLLARTLNTEDLQVVHYNPGQKYDSHHDWGVSGYPESRYITLLLYLNDQLTPSSGGETSFPLGVRGDGGIGFKVRPRKGSAVLFYNLLPDGNADNLALHGALPVIEGEKWLANFWIWDHKIK